MTNEYTPSGNPEVVASGDGGSAGEPVRKKPGPKPGSKKKPTRAQSEKRQRRRRENFTDSHNLKLNVPEEAKDPGYVYRWINDTANGRLLDKTKFDDWDVVDVDQMKGYADPQKNVDGGQQMCRIVGTQRDSNEPLRGYLCRKPRDWYEEDKLKEQRPLDEIDEQLKRGQVPGVNIHKDDQDKIYLPQGPNNIERR